MRWRTPPSAITGRGSRTCARRSPTSSRIASSSCSTEKSVTGQAAWNRLFDDTIANLRFDVAGKTLAIEPTLNLLQDRSEKTRKGAAEALAKTFRENLSTFTLITNTLAKDKEI